MPWIDKERPYTLSYEAYWSSKGDYGKIRVERSNKRKKARRLKRKEKKRRCPCCGQWKDDNWGW